jgi:hypothetical protein
MEEVDNNKEFEPKYPAQLYTARPNPTALLSPLYDSTFKGIFTQETDDSNLALQSFISAVLGRTVKKIFNEKQRAFLELVEKAKKKVNNLVRKRKPLKKFWSKKNNTPCRPSTIRITSTIF